MKLRIDRPVTTSAGNAPGINRDYLRTYTVNTERRTLHLSWIVIGAASSHHISSLSLSLPHTMLGFPLP